MDFKSPKKIFWIISIVIAVIASGQKFFPGNLNLPIVSGNEFETLLGGFATLLVGSFLKK